MKPTIEQIKKYIIDNEINLEINFYDNSNQYLYVFEDSKHIKYVSNPFKYNQLTFINPTYKTLVDKGIISYLKLSYNDSNVIDFNILQDKRMLNNYFICTIEDKTFIVEYKEYEDVVKDSNYYKVTEPTIEITPSVEITPSIDDEVNNIENII